MARGVMALMIGMVAVGVLAQTPRIQNGLVETRAATSLARDVATLAAQATDPMWVAWQVPMVDGERSLCCTCYNDDMPQAVRGCRMEPTNPDDPWTPPRFPAPSGPVQLEAGTELTMFVRMVERRIERVRLLSDDCPVDAGGRAVRWLTGVRGADSVAFLNALATDETMANDVRTRIASAAVRGIALHRDPSAVPALIALASAPATTPLAITTRREAVQGVGQSRDPRALQFLQHIITR